MNIAEIATRIGFDVKVFIFNLINFLILAYLLKKFFFDKIMSIMRLREKEIQEGIALKNKAQEELNTITKQKEAILIETEKKAQVMLDEARAQSEEETEKLRMETIAMTAQLKEQQKAQLEAEKANMLRDFKNQATDLVIKTAQTIIRQSKFNT